MHGTIDTTDWQYLASQVRIRETARLYTRWTDDELRDAIILYRAGYTWRQIALRLGRTEGAVVWQFDKMKAQGVI